MSILRRLLLIGRSYLNYIIGKAEDPEKLLNQMLIDMDEHLMNAKRQVAFAISDEKKLLTQYLDAKKKMNIWREKAEIAVQASRDDLAKKALERYTLYKQESINLENHWKNQKNAVEKLKIALNTLTAKINDAKIKKNLLVARAKKATATQNISVTMSNIAGGKNTIQALNSMEDKISKMEAEANAATTMASEIEVDELNAQFEDLRLSSTDNELSKIKRQLSSKKVLKLSAVKKEDISAIEKDIEKEKSIK
jgi:phage shock protein A